MRTDYFFELDWMELDYDSLYQVCLSPSKESRKLLPHQRYVSDDKYMQAIRDKYPFMGSLFNIYFIKNGLPIHIDAKRKCALNIPVKNTQDSSTIWYHNSDTIKTEYDPQMVVHTVKTTVNEECRMTLSKPTLMKIDVPHSVENKSREPRVTISWALPMDIDYEEACRLFNHAR